MSVNTNQSNVYRSHFYFLSDPENTEGVKITLGNGKFKYMFRQSRGFSRQPFNEIELRSFTRVLVATFLEIHVPDLQQFLVAYDENQCILNHTVKRSCDNSFSPIRYQMVQNDKTVINFDITSTGGAFENINAILFNPHIECPYSIEEIGSRLNLVNLVKYIDTTYGYGVSQLLSKYITKIVSELKITLYNLFLHDTRDEVLRMLLPKSVDYYIFWEVINHISSDTEGAAKKRLNRLKGVRDVNRTRKLKYVGGT